jgi:hypothetical protein
MWPMFYGPCLPVDQQRGAEFHGNGSAGFPDPGTTPFSSAEYPARQGPRRGVHGLFTPTKERN